MMDMAKRREPESSDESVLLLKRAKTEIVTVDNNPGTLIQVHK